MPVIVNHNVNISIEQMVRNRLPFLVAAPENTVLLSNFTLEVMWELEPCFQISKLEDGTIDLTRVGQEQYYSIIQQSIIADIVATYILLIQGANGIGVIAGNTTTPTLGTFLKRAKAGSAEVEYDQFTTGSATAASAFGLGVGPLLDKYRKSAIKKAAFTGCFFDICDDCTVAFLVAPPSVFAISAPKPCGCGCPSC